MKQISATGDGATAKSAYFALFEIHLRYGFVIWGAEPAANLEKILQTQKKVVKTLR